MSNTDWLPRNFTKIETKEDKWILITILTPFWKLIYTTSQRQRVTIFFIRKLHAQPMCLEPTNSSFTFLFFFSFFFLWCVSFGTQRKRNMRFKLVTSISSGVIPNQLYICTTSWASPLTLLLQGDEMRCDLN